MEIASILSPMTGTLVRSTRLVPLFPHNDHIDDGNSIRYPLEKRLADIPELCVPHSIFDGSVPFVVLAIQQTSMNFTGNKRLSIAPESAHFLRQEDGESQTYHFRRTDILRRDELSEEQLSIIGELSTRLLIDYGLSSVAE